MGKTKRGPSRQQGARFRSDAWRPSARQERDSGEIPRSRAMEAVAVEVARKWWLGWLKQRWWLRNWGCQRQCRPTAGALPTQREGQTGDGKAGEWSAHCAA